MNRCTGIILAGGWSKRFGRDKATVVWDGRRFIDHIAEALRSVCDETIAVIRPDQQALDWPVDRVVRDEMSLPEGPLRGMHAGLANAAHPAFIVACDSPLLQVTLLQLLIDQDNNAHDALVPIWKGRPQSLHGLYHPQCAAIFHRALMAGESAPKKVLSQMNCCLLDKAIVQKADPSGLSFLNINRQEDFNQLSNQVGQAFQPASCDTDNL